VSARYDAIGASYTATRRSDPRIAATIAAALGDARTVLNVGAGAGAYEPADREVLAVEPSATMRAQRPAGAAPVFDAVAEAFPFPDGAFDATLAVLSDHHWRDRPAGLRELRRVAARRAVLFQWDPGFADAFWLTREYLPSFARMPTMPFTALVRHLGATRVVPVPIPADCEDGFFMAYWRRPEAYLDPVVRANISVFHELPPAEVQAGLERLADDLASGAWAARHAALLERDELDLGYRLLVAELTRSA